MVHLLGKWWLRVDVPKEQQLWGGHRCYLCASWHEGPVINFVWYQRRMIKTWAICCSYITTSIAWRHSDINLTFEMMLTRRLKRPTHTQRSPSDTLDQETETGLACPKNPHVSPAWCISGGISWWQQCFPPRVSTVEAGWLLIGCRLPLAHNTITLSYSSAPSCKTRATPQSNWRQKNSSNPGQKYFPNCKMLSPNLKVAMNDEEKNLLARVVLYRCLLKHSCSFAC